MIMLRLKILLFFAIFFKTSSCTSDECGIQNVICDHSASYRSFDGTCNNLKNPGWGSTNSLYDRLVPAKYGDEMGDYAKAVNGSELPNARNVSLYTSGEKPVQDPDYTLLCMQYGELVTHDMSSNLIYVRPSFCCTASLKHRPKTPVGCSIIDIPKDDPYYSYIDATCLSMLRTITNRNLSCATSLNYTEQVSAVNSFLDLSVIYANTDADHKSLRSFKNGALLVEHRKNQEWLPSSKTYEECTLKLNDKGRCYRTGDARLDQNPQLVVLHVLWAREHNRIARKLQKLNPHWDDEKLFQEARKIAIAEHQHITYYEMLPCYLGLKNCKDQGLIYDRQGFVNDYDENMRPHIFSEHAHAAFRHFHSLIAGQLNLVNQEGCPFASIVLRDHMNIPYVVEEDDDNFDGLIQGLNTQPQMASDINYVPDVTRFAFMRKARFGHDLRAVDIQRARDHGVASYNTLREYCKLPRATSFDDFLDVMDKDNMEKLKLVYEHPDDVDLLVGAGMERNMDGARAGPTFLCIMYKQFYRTRKSDRFWYENENSGFTDEQLKEIKKFTVSRLFCNNGNNITRIQKYSFLLKSDSNPRVHCSTVPGPNLNLWKDKI